MDLASLSLSSRAVAQWRSWRLSCSILRGVVEIWGLSPGGLPALAHFARAPGALSCPPMPVAADKPSDQTELCLRKDGERAQPLLAAAAAALLPPPVPPAVAA